MCKYSLPKPVLYADAIKVGVTYVDDSDPRNVETIHLDPEDVQKLGYVPTPKQAVTYVMTKGIAP